MECVECGRPIVPHRGRPWASQWCSAACRRRFIHDLRELSLTVARWSAAIEMPEVVAARDDLVRRYVASATAPRSSPARRRAEPRAKPRKPSFAERDVDELPVYWS